MTYRDRDEAGSTGSSRLALSRVRPGLTLDGGDFSLFPLPSFALPLPLLQLPHRVYVSRDRHGRQRWRGRGIALASRARGLWSASIISTRRIGA
jgi:hypothetical protein